MLAQTTPQNLAPKIHVPTCLACTGDVTGGRTPPTGHRGENAHTHRIGPEFKTPSQAKEGIHLQYCDQLILILFRVIETRTRYGQMWIKPVQSHVTTATYTVTGAIHAIIAAFVIWSDSDP